MDPVDSYVSTPVLSPPTTNHRPTNIDRNSTVTAHYHGRQLPCVSRGEAKPGPPAATYPPLAPHESGEVQNEKSWAYPPSVNLAAATKYHK
eukprot:SAG22_NODE_512_length_9579_cov_27.293143_9_plen_91_part_00